MEHSERHIKLASLTSITVLGLLLLASHQVRCNTPQIDHHLHPAAQMAVSKIQRPLTPNSPSSSPPPSSSAIVLQPNEIANHDKFASGRQSNDIETNESETTESGTWGMLEQLSSESQAAGSLPSQQPGEVVVSSTESLTQDPTTLADVAKNSEPETIRDEQAANVVELAENASSEQSTSEQTTARSKTSTTTSSAALERTNEPEISLATVKETENEAVAAVDASIGFGGSELFGADADTCYDEYGNARFCEPEFENIAFERQVEVSSECGRPASRFCTTYVNERNDQIRNCHICDAQHPKKSHPASYLTDMHNSNAPTCWVSAPIGIATGNAPDTDSIREASRDNVTLTLNFDKKYEITYVIMQFCSLKPDSLAIHKSQDFGRTWAPYQFYSSLCSKIYQSSDSWSPPRSPEDRLNKSSKIEPICLDSTSVSGGQSSARVAFSTLDNLYSRPATKPSEMLGEVQTERSSHIQDWMTATNIRITLDRHQANWIQSSSAQHHRQPSKGSEQAESEQGGRQASSWNSSALNEAAQLTPLEASLTNPSDTYNYALADLTVGGRCKCNGHASRCVHGDDGLLTCDCRHNTAGRDCERCASFHHDRPWQRATHLDANPCQPCQCNGHSRKCRFDPELYQLSGKRSGGVCTFCRDNTAGRHCHYCKEGYVRDHSKPMSDKEACKLCDCHPVGSLGRVCNQTTGQCPCKEGVTGLECNRCAPGYQQSSSPSEPCIKLPENTLNYEPIIEDASVEDSVADRNTLEENTDSQEPIVWTPGGGGTAETRQVPPPNGRSVQDDAFQESRGDFVANQLEDQYHSQNPPRERTSLMNSLGDGRGRRLQVRKRSRGRYNHAKQNNLKIHYPNVDETSNISDRDEQEYSAQGRSHGGGHIIYDQDKQYSDARNNLRTTQESVAVETDAVYNNREIFPSVSYVTPSFDDPIDGQQGIVANHIQVFGESEQNNSPRSFRQHLDNNSYQLGANSRRHSQHIVGSRKRIYHQHLDESSLACGNCRSDGKRLGFTRFCQIDYAIKAQVLNMFMADDWIRFDLEIQDVFKSPVYGDQHLALLQHNLSHHVEKYVTPENPLLTVNHDEPNTSSTGNGTKQGPNSTQQHITAPTKSQAVFTLDNRSTQSIWVPTEDVVCNCPRLRLRTAYLLMGMVDKRGNPVMTIQLDRHGVAIEWKSTLQERLIKYQRRYSKGRC